MNTILRRAHLWNKSIEALQLASLALAISLLRYGIIDKDSNDNAQAVATILLAAGGFLIALLAALLVARMIQPRKSNRVLLDWRLILSMTGIGILGSTVFNGVDGPTDTIVVMAIPIVAAWTFSRYLASRGRSQE